MKKMIMMMAVVMAGVAVQAQPPAGLATPGTKYGEGASVSAGVPIALLPGRLDTAAGVIPVTVKAKVLDVCPKKGCWLRLQVNDSTTAFVKMKNYGFFLPLDIKGKTIVLDGEASVLTTSVAELRHYAQDAKKSPEQIAAISQPKKEISLTATGIVVVE